MNSNLHIHSRYSDGTLWPEEILKKSASLGLETVCITDHDALAGSVYAHKHAHEYGLSSYIGCEIDCVDSSLGYDSEILGYFPSGCYSSTEAFLDSRRQARFDRLVKMIRWFSEFTGDKTLNISDISNAKIRDGVPAEEISFSKVDLFSYLKKKQAIPGSYDYSMFKKTFFSSKMVNVGKFPKPTVMETAKTIISDGGYVVIPHPGHEFDDSFSKIKDNLNRFRTLLVTFAGYGVSGIELYHYRNAKRDKINDLVAHEAEAFGLFVTYGSDCHGPGSEKDTLGLFSGDFEGFPDSGKETA